MKLYNQFTAFFILACFLIASELGSVSGKRLGDKIDASVENNNNEHRKLQGFQFALNLNGFLFWIPNILKIQYRTGWAELISCFSSNTIAEVRGRGKVKMSEIQVGDEVLTSKGKYETVYAIDHRHPTKSTKFIQIHTTETEEQPLELTAKHMVFLEGNSNPVPAMRLKVGDQVQTLNGPTEVEKINTITRNGVYNFLTYDGTIVASGIISSTYSAHFSDNEYIEISGYQIMSHQKFFHALLKPYKYVCTGVSLELCKTKREMILVEQIAVHMLNKHWLQEKNEVHQTIALSLVVLFVCMLDLLTSPYSLLLATTVIGSLVLMKSKKKISKRKTA